MDVLTYLHPNCQLTLRQAIAALRAAEGLENDAAAQVAPDLASDLDIHDVIHVIFGCSTDLRGEVLAHIWTLLGTDVKMSDLHRVTNHRDHRAALVKIGHLRLIAMWLRSLPSLAMVAVRAAKMRKNLLVKDVDTLLDRRLSDIRQDLGIHLPEPRDGANPPKGYGALVRQAGR